MRVVGSAAQELRSTSIILQPRMLAEVPLAKETSAMLNDNGPPKNQCDQRRTVSSVKSSGRSKNGFIMQKKLLLIGCFIAGLLLRIPYSLAEQPQDPMPPAAIAVLKQFDKDVDIARTKAIVGLEKVLKDTTKKGDLPGALAVKEAVDQLKAEVRGRVAGRPVVDRAGKHSIVGRWIEGSHTADLQADGSITASSGLAGQWTWDGRAVQITWNNGTIYKLQVELDDLVGTKITDGKESGTVRWTRPK